MPFSDETIVQAWVRANNRCECRRVSHKHPRGRCDERIILGRRGKFGPGAWDAHHIDPIGGDDLANCEILCWKCLKLIS